MYSKKVMEHFMRPHNQGKIKNPDGIGIVGNPKCGDIMRMYIKVGKNNKNEEMIKDIKFETLGCGAAIATSSATTDMAKGKTFKEALEIDRNVVADELGGLPPIKMHCSNLAADALRRAIEDYNNKKKKNVK
ncbi:MAG TPA: iron-sulfur cluster assembly scaffold protein [Candidatus Moranbacteria bacterium]|jgi:nitrogen fixation NifU-like protein|nr:iron-sulfur cluster assembly scaffold protein [Candidatus Moranbacteria bacterium]HQB59217.1 iron-sulfur cluster assembly scaffold protein [Candidatus Moranbacteria bacterium]